MAQIEDHQRVTYKGYRGIILRHKKCETPYGNYRFNSNTYQTFVQALRIPELTKQTRILVPRGTS